MKTDLLVLCVTLWATTTTSAARQIALASTLSETPATAPDAPREGPDASWEPTASARGGDELADSGGNPTAARRDPPGDRPRRLVAHRLQPRVRLQLTAGWRLALAQLNDFEECRALFRDLGADPFQSLARTWYTSAATQDETAICHQRGASAFTSLGSPRVVLCDRFVSQSRRLAAATVIHEALHRAGRSEWPHDPHGLESSEITSLVRERCRL
jgi:hypothetical protein